MKIHRGWFILIISILNLLACLGFGRFSLGAIIPFMKDGLQLTYSEVGIITSGVFLGYLVGALTVGYVLKSISVKTVIITGLSMLAGGMLFSSVVFNFLSAYFACLIIGFGSGSANVPSLSLVGRWFSPKYRGKALGIANSGIGFGMVISGFLVPYLMVINPTEGWRISWGLLAAAVIVIILINFFFLVESPEKIGTKPIGSGGALQVNIVKQNDETNGFMIKNIYTDKMMWIIGGIYLAWGFSYLIFTTFFVDYLINEMLIDKKIAGQFFATAGIASVFSGFIWGSISDRIGRMKALFFICFIQATLLLAFTFTTSHALLYGETILYALTLWGVPTVIIATITVYTEVKTTSIAIGFITLFFGIGQWVSPMVTGYLIDLFNSYTVAIYVSAAVCYIGSLACIYAHRRHMSLKNNVVIENGVSAK